MAAQERAAMEAAMAQGAAAAARPGDEDLTCAQIETELAATVNSDAVQGNVAENAAIAEEQRARMAEARAQSAAGAAGNIAAGIAGAYVPGAAAAQQAAMAAQFASAQAQMGQAHGQRRQMAGNLREIMPQMMRGQRLVELGQARNCAFVQGQMGR